MHGLFSWIIMGLIAGVLAKFLHPGKDGGGIIMTILLGIGGALLGGWIGARFLNVGAVSGFNLQSIGLAAGGSLLILIVHRMIAGKS